MKHHVASTIDNLITILLLVVAAVTPLLVFSQATEFYEMPKLAFLVVMTTVLIVLWSVSWIFKGRIEITRTPLDIPLFALLIIVLVSTFYSPSHYPAIWGNFPRVHESAISWVTYILLYFVTVSNLRDMAKVKAFVYVLAGSAIVVALATLMSFFNIFLPFDFAKSANFTPTGSTFSTNAFLLLLLPVALLSILKPNKYLPVPFAVALAVLFGLTVALTGSLETYIVMALEFLLCVMVMRPSNLQKNINTLVMFLIPVAVIVIALVFAYLPVPGNKLQQMEASFPREIQLPVNMSWVISASAFRDAPVLGTGPSSFLFDFTSYKPIEFNSLTYWNFTFDTAYNEFLQVLATLGVLGLAALALLCVVVIFNSRNHLKLDHEEDTHILIPALTISALVSILLLVIHATTLVSFVATLFILAALMASQKSIREKVFHLSMGIKASSGDNQFDLFPVILFVIFLIAGVYVLYQTYNATLADYYHHQALVDASKNGTQTYTDLQKAETLNPVIDLYRVDLAQTNFALANAIAVRKGPSASNKNGSLTTQDKTTIQTLLSQAINEGRVSVALSPLSSRNWSVLASIYRNISGVAQNALTFSLDAYGRAIQRDPLNPVLRLNVGGIYYSVKNYELAVRFFTDAANLKPDYANAYYNLAIALRDKGDIQNAVIVAQQTVTLLQKTPNSPDYKTATQLLADLKSKAAQSNSNNANASTNTQTAPAAQTNSALGNSNLQNQNVNVSNLNNPPQVTTPATVKPNPNAKVPQAGPTSAAQPTTAPTPAH